MNALPHNAFAATLLCGLAMGLGSVRIFAEPATPGDSGVAPKGFTEIARRVMPAVVFISVTKSLALDRDPRAPHGLNDPFGYFDDEFRRRFFGQGPRGRDPGVYRQFGQGSGFIISKDGYILTNHHVVGDVDEITVKLHDGREFKARLVGADPQSEVAVIQIEGDNLPVLPLGNSDHLEIGEWVIAVGNPFGLSETLTVGVVSATGRNNVGIADYENFIQTDAAINPGNSGGPLVNTRGEAVGINTAIFSRSGGYMGIGFAVPMNMAGSIKDQLIQKGRVDRGYIGIVIQDVTPELAPSFGLADPRGILIARVEEDSAGDRAGLKAGDVIRKLNGKEAGNRSSFRNAVAATPPGSAVELDLIRDGSPRSVRVTIGALDNPFAGTGSGPGTGGDTGRGELGFAVDNLSPEVAQRFGYEGEQGVIIQEVENDSPADRAGLRPGQLITRVNRRAVASVKDFEEAVRTAAKDHSIVLLVTDGNFSRFVALSLQ